MGLWQVTVPFLALTVYCNYNKGKVIHSKHTLFILPAKQQKYM